MHLTGMAYFAEIDEFSHTVAKLDKITWTREPSQDFIARDLRVISFFGLILRVQPGSVGMDVKRNILAPVSITGKSEDERAWMLTAGSFSSAAESAVFEQIYGIESVSTEKILYMANQRGIPIYTLNKDNINQILPSLPLANIVKQNISDAVLNSGWIAVVPRTGLQVNQWFGYGWQIIDPNTGAAAYLLAGYLTSGSEIITGGGAGSRVADWIATAIAGALAGLFGYLEYRAEIIRYLGSAFLAALSGGEFFLAFFAGSLTLLSILLFIAAVIFVFVFVRYYIWPRYFSRRKLDCIDHPYECGLLYHQTNAMQVV
ncbi:MAG: hypothetical protein M1438_07825 [Deltaproteobacteria bacterium]|nr:hypothetical protein [Deltaproteobacteria bacterium]